MESFSDNLAGVGNQNKGRRILFLDKVTEFDCLLTVQRCKNNVSLFTGKYIVVSKGLGTHTINFRFWNPAELVVLDIIPAFLYNK